jgi:hypothetical protein
MLSEIFTPLFKRIQKNKKSPKYKQGDILYFSLNVKYNFCQRKVVIPPFSQREMSP